MDGQRFDRLTKVLAGGVSRRTVVGGLTGLAAGLVGVRVGDAACGPDQIARRGACLCKTTGRPPGADGLCPCGSGLTRCGAACVHLTRDLTHCGACGHDCAADVPNAALICRQGVCRITTCAAGWATCDGNDSTGCETALGTNDDCAACDDACTLPETCGGGDQADVCGCTPDCTGKTCGADDGCGGTCVIADCPLTQTCLPGGCGCVEPRVLLANGTCAYPCSPPSFDHPVCQELCGGVCKETSPGTYCLTQETLFIPCGFHGDCPVGSACVAGLCDLPC